MSLKKKIDADFIQAFKDKNTLKKDTLGMLKTKISEGEKKDGKELSDADIVNIIKAYDKQLDQTIASVSDGQLKDNTLLEKQVVSEYLPKQMSEGEITEKVKEFVESYTGDSKMLFPEIMKYFKGKYNGSYNAAVVKSVFESLPKV